MSHSPLDVLDVGCGNDATAAGLTGKRITGSYTGVDLAGVKLSDVAKEKLNASNALKAQLKPNTDAEQLPIESASVDVAVSVFGIEYSDLQKSLP